MTDTTAAPAPAPAPAPAAPAVPWLGEVSDTELVGHVQAAGWQGPADAVKSHRELQKLLGADRAGRTFTVPKDDSDADGWSQVYSKLGRPEKPELYALPVPEGDDGAFAKAASQWFHEAGLSAKQAQLLASHWNTHMTAAQKQAAMAEQAELQKESEALAADWGSAAEEQTRIARRAAVKLGLDEPAIDALQKVQGFAKTMKALAKMGELLGEHNAVGLDQSGSFGLTPEAARALKAQKMADPEWTKKAMNPNSSEWAEMQRYDSVLAAAQDAMR